DYASFFQKKMKKAIFTNCQMRETDFTETDLSAAVFNGCDLRNAVFMLTKLEKTDFRKAINYVLDPEKNLLKKTRFSFAGLPGLLAKYDIEIE
ncbi:MAG TPA: pentapeptide repeat-containing protein, partial [Chitinophagaceae bacterium]|nr:pentapeptide repeat-containing protein [Chitinophagaceae bacterium]